MPLVMTAEALPDVDTLLVSGAVRTDEDHFRLLEAAEHAHEIIAVGTCAISGGVANLGDRDEVRARFFAQTERRHVPRMLPHPHPVDSVVAVDRYLPGCPPTPRLFMAALFESEAFTPAKTVCLDCGRTKIRQRPNKLIPFQAGHVIDSDICLINQGFLCIGSSTRGGCGAPCTRAGHPCVGCRGPSDGFISRSSEEWFEAIQRVFAKMTDIDSFTIDRALRSPQLALFVFQFADYTGTVRDKEKVL